MKIFNKRIKTLPGSLKMLVAVMSAATVMSAFAAVPDTERNFVACPIVLDTEDIPCWVVEHEGERYFLTMQTGRSGGVVFSPQLKHQVLVEGTVQPDEPRICGGLVMGPVKLSVLDEVIPDCGEMRPGEGYHVTGPRPIGPDGDPPGGKSTAVRPPRPEGAPSRAELAQQFNDAAIAGQPRDFEILYFFDSNYLPFPVEQATVDQAADYATMMGNARVTVMGYRGQANLSNGEVLEEDVQLARARAEKVADILRNFGVPDNQITVEWEDAPQHNDGVLDWQLRKVVVSVNPGT